MVYCNQTVGRRDPCRLDHMKVDAVDNYPLGVAGIPQYWMAQSNRSSFLPHRDRSVYLQIWMGKGQMELGLGESHIPLTFVGCMCLKVALLACGRNSVQQ